MPYNALIEYIRSARQCGASNVEISKRLNTAGWYSVDIQDALALYERLTAPARSDRPMPGAPMPSLDERMIPHAYDRHLVAVAVISFAIGFIAYIWLAYF